MFLLIENKRISANMYVCRFVFISNVDVSIGLRNPESIGPLLPPDAASTVDFSLTLDSWCVQKRSPRRRAQSRQPQRQQQQQQQQRAAACRALQTAGLSWRDTKPESTRGCTAAPSATRSSRTAATSTDTSDLTVRGHLKSSFGVSKQWNCSSLSETSHNSNTVKLGTMGNESLLVYSQVISCSNVMNVTSCSAARRVWSSTSLISTARMWWVNLQTVLISGVFTDPAS